MNNQLRMSAEQFRKQHGGVAVGTVKDYSKKQSHGNIPNRTHVQGSKLERTPVHDPLAAAQAQKGNHQRFHVRIISYRLRLLDEDNLAGKYHCDLLRYSGILPSDAPQFTKIENTQVKVTKKSEEKTIIQVTENHPI